MRARAFSLAEALKIGLSGQHWADVADIPGAVARMAELLDQDPSYATKSIAAAWIAFMGGDEAIPALGRALRKPHFLLRYQVLELLNRFFPDNIRAEDLIFLVKDAVLHVAPRVRRNNPTLLRAVAYLPEVLEDAIVRRRPPGVIEPLVCLIEGRGTPRRDTRFELGPSWALVVLATAFPEEALPHIDRLFANVSSEARKIATEAARCLPAALARPRLLIAAADPVPDIAEIALACELEGAEPLAPIDPMANVQTALLNKPPSEVMRSRLELLRRGPLEARAAMVEVLLDEAPEREALVLLLFAMLDSRVWERGLRPGLPTNYSDVCTTLIERFGAPAVRGIAELDARYPKSFWTWIHVLFVHLLDNKIPVDAYPALRQAAARRIADTAETPHASALHILARVGPPPELADRLWHIARDPSPEMSFARSSACKALAHLPPEAGAGDGGGLDAAVLAEMKAALAAADVARFALAAPVGIGRNLPEAIALTQGILSGAEVEHGRPADVHLVMLLAACAEALLDAGHLPDTWLAQALGRTGTYLCAIAARAAWFRELLEPESEAFKALLADEDAICAAAAACALTGKGVIGPEHATALLSLAARTPPALRGHLIDRMWWRRVAPPGDLWPLMVPVLISADPEVTEPMCYLSHEFDKPELSGLLKEILPQVVDPRLRQDITDILTKKEKYWIDAPEDAEEKL